MYYLAAQHIGGNSLRAEEKRASQDIHAFIVLAGEAAGLTWSGWLASGSWMGRVASDTFENMKSGVDLDVTLRPSTTWCATIIFLHVSIQSRLWMALTPEHRISSDAKVAVSHPLQSCGCAHVQRGPQAAAGGGAPHHRLLPWVAWVVGAHGAGAGVPPVYPAAIERRGEEVFIMRSIQLCVAVSIARRVNGLSVKIWSSRMRATF